MPLDLKIDSLRVAIANAAGHEHRLPHIASRAAALFGERLSQTIGEADPAAIDALEARPINLNLATATNEQAARAIAAAWLDALPVRVPTRSSTANTPHQPLSRGTTPWPH